MSVPATNLTARKISNALMTVTWSARDAGATLVPRRPDGKPEEDPAKMDFATVDLSRVEVLLSEMEGALKVAREAVSALRYEVSQQPKEAT